MNKELTQIFKNNEFGNVRVVLVGESKEPYFVGKDVAECLGYSDTADAIKRHVDSEDKLTRSFTDSGQNRKMYVINESGLYSLILSSKLSKAKQFKRWVTSEVLPSIRKHGVYATNSFIDEALNNPDTAIKLLEQIKTEREQKLKLEQQLQDAQPKVIFADAVSVSKTTILIGDLAKLLKQNGIDIGQKRLFEWLRKNKYLISRAGADYNSPTQYSMERGLMEIKEGSHVHSDGHVSITKTPKITGKGQQYFINKFLVKNQ